MSIDYAVIWNKIMQSLREEIGSTSFDIWFSQAKYDSFLNNNMIVTVPNSLTKEWIESRYLDIILDKLRSMINQDVFLVLTTDSSLDHKISSLNRKYTFDTFVVGNSNRFAHAACYAVGESPLRLIIRFLYTAA